jgi:hypothetical protein
MKQIKKTMKDCIKVCTCTQCRFVKNKKKTSVKKFFKRLMNKKRRKMDLENPEYVNFYYA